MIWLDLKIIFSKAMATLHNYSLVECTPEGYSLHTCVHDWTLQALSNVNAEDKYWDAVLCIAANVKDLDTAYFWQANYRLLPHADRLCNFRIQIPSKGGFHDESQAYSLNWIGFLWQNQGNNEKAEPFYSAALAIYTRLLGDNDQRTLGVKANLASIYRETDRIVEAQNLYNRVLETCEQTAVSDQSFINIVRHDLALLHRNQGKLSEAEILLRKVLASEEAAFGLGYPAVPQIATSLADVLHRQGKLTEAGALSQRAADGLTRSLGPSHVLTLNAMSCRAEVYVDQDEWEQAGSLYKMILEGENSCYGSQHAQTLDTVRSLAKVYLRQEKLGDLVELADRWGGREHALYGYLERLGRFSLRKGNQSMARAAYIKSLYFDRGVLTWRASSWCDVCQLEQEDHQCITLAMGQFVCLECDNVDLCRTCYEKYQAGEETVAGCIGHKFFELPTQIPSGDTT